MNRWGKNMAVLHDYKCAVHGFFESHDALCPHGCEDVQLVFLQPVGMRSDSTRHADTTLNELARDYGMSDIKSVREGESQPNPLLQNKQAARSDHPFAVKWGNPKEIGNFSLNSVRGEQVQGLASMKESGVSLPKLRPAAVIRDHENLQVKS